ncbi:M48 family metalloprotease [Streptomyces sp. NPDC058595]|uniref:M48 family metalloprotease n=1 Tax=Streptomyces sp. NPDC058595 TaxID=3346550 RepID=UPI00364FFEE4
MPQQPARHPHELDFEQRRAHIARHQRATDITAWGQLLLHLPNFTASLLLITGISVTLFDNAPWIPVAVWIASGALVFHRPTESFFATNFLHLRRPSAAEAARLGPIWREVTLRAGIDGANYELWIEESDGLNAYAAAGHIVGVTRFSLDRLPSGQLAGVLAHELGHHTGGHAWSGLLGFWYALPGRFAWVVVRKVVLGLMVVSSYISPLVTGALALVLGCGLVSIVTTAWFIVLPVLLAPYLLAGVSRQAELRADRHAAALGFAPMLVEVLEAMHAEGEAQTAALHAVGRAPRRPGTLAKLLSSHPDLHTRLHHLQRHLPPGPSGH